MLNRRSLLYGTVSAALAGPLAGSAQDAERVPRIGYLGGSSKRFSSAIPIVMATSADPVGAGYASSLARPGGNITGLSGQLRELPLKRIELIKDLLPTAVRLGHLTLPDPNLADITAGGAELAVAARAMGLAYKPFPVQHRDDLEPAFAAMSREGVDVVMVGVQSFTFLHRERIARLGLLHKLPLVGGFRELPAAGGLLSYGVDSPDLWRRAASYVDRILKGANPGDLPIEQPSTTVILRVTWRLRMACTSVMLLLPAAVAGVAPDSDRNAVHVSTTGGATMRPCDPHPSSRHPPPLSCSCSRGSIPGCASMAPRAEKYVPPPIGATWVTARHDTGSYGSGNAPGCTHPERAPIAWAHY